MATNISSRSVPPMTRVNAADVSTRWSSSRHGKRNRPQDNSGNALRTDGLAVTLQNGLGNRETLARSLGSSRVALGVTTTGATLLGPGSGKRGRRGEHLH